MGVYADLAAALEAAPVVEAIISFGAVYAAVSAGNWAVKEIACFFDDYGEARWAKRMEEIGRQSIAGNKDEVARLVDREKR